MKKILIISRAQFGYYVDPFKYCEYLKDQYDITYVSWDFGHPRLELAGIEVVYVPRIGNKALRYFRFLKGVHNEMNSKKYDLIFMVFFPGVSLLKIFNPTKLINLDIRTASVLKNRVRNFFNDLFIKLECSFFDNVSVITEGVAKNLNIKKYHLLPLGGESFTQKDKTFENIHLIYVGTLENRDMINCVRGFHMFLEKFWNETLTKSIKFTLIGDSPGNELSEINEYIQKNNLGNIIKTEGYVLNAKLKPYMEEANIGISYVPITDYFDVQPPTKTYEYLLSGLPVIATKTFENTKVINDQNGVLIEDSSESFCDGLNLLTSRKERFNSSEIRRINQQYHWQSIIFTSLKNYFEELMKKP